MKTPRKISWLMIGFASVLSASSSAQQPEGRLALLLSTDKTAYTLGEPIVLSIELRNRGDTAQTAIYRLGPEYGLVRYSIGESGREQAVFQPISHVNVRSSFRDQLGPQSSFYDVAKLFFANNGWTFRRPGQYTVTVVYPDKERPLTADLQIEVIEPPDDGRAAAERMLSNNQQGLLLYWEHGDHLTEGVRNLQSIAREFPESQLASYANFGLGVNLSKKFYDARTNALRRPDHPAAIDHLTKALDGEMDSYFRVQALLSLAESYMAVGEIESTRRVLSRLIDEFGEDMRYRRQVGRGRQLFEEAR